MIYLDRLIRVVLLEEGQTLISLDDLGITQEDLEDLFEGVYEQARPYAQRYIRKTMRGSMSPITLPEAVAVKRVTYNVYEGFTRPVPDVPDNMWDFDPHTKQFRSFASTSYVVEYLTYPKCDYLEISEVLTQKNGKIFFNLPCDYNPESLVLTQGNLKATCEKSSIAGEYNLRGDLGTGLISKRRELAISLSDVAKEELISLSYRTKYKAIEEWDMKVEVFVVWFKAALLSLIGSIKEQAGNIDPAALPFDVNRDTLLGRARELWAKVDELKINKSAWYEF